MRVLEAQTRRLLADARADALGSRFAAQWLRLQDVDKVHPDPNFYPNFDENLADAMRRETVMFFNSLVKDDRSLLELFRADFTFVNERLAQHYGIPNVAGNEFRRVQYPDASRRGLLGQGAILVQTSLANRTSPVLRGKWVLEVLVGAPPPAPPPNIPTLEETAGSKDGKLLTTRERMEMHRANAVCSACHQMMDPIGLALDNFDVTAQWRVREIGMPLDTRGDYFDGSPVTSPSELVDVMLKRPVPLVRTFTENLLAYALGRRAEYFDQPLIRAIAKNAEKDGYRMSSFILGVVKSDAFRMKRAEPVTETARRLQRANPTFEETETMSFITGKHMARRTFLRGVGATVALPFLDAMVPAGRIFAKAPAAERTRLLCIEEVHGLAGCNNLGREQVPVRAGDGGARLQADRRQPALDARGATANT